MEQGTLDFERFDADGARRDRDEAISRAGERDEGYWASLAYAAVLGTAKSLETFTTDDVMKGFPSLERIPELRVLGFALREAAKEGVCKATDRYAGSDRRQSHGRPKRVWRSLVFNRG